MRLSVDRDDLGYHPACYNIVECVRMNGLLVERCITADEEKGLVCYYPEPLRRDPEDPEQAYRRTIYGDVEIVFKDGGREAAERWFAEHREGFAKR